MFQHDNEQGTFTFRTSGNIGQEILNSNGKVVCWTISEWLAALIVYLLNQAQEEGLPI